MGWAEYIEEKILERTSEVNKNKEKQNKDKKAKLTVTKEAIEKRSRAFLTEATKDLELESNEIIRDITLEDVGEGIKNMDKSKAPGKDQSIAGFLKSSTSTEGTEYTKGNL